jgi:hypothetical protein
MGMGKGIWIGVLLSLTTSLPSFACWEGRGAWLDNFNHGIRRNNGTRVQHLRALQDRSIERNSVTQERRFKTPGRFRPAYPLALA